MRCQPSTADSDVKRDPGLIQSSSSTTSYDCHTPDDDTIQHPGAFHGARKRASTLSTMRLGHSTSRDPDSGELEPREPKDGEFRPGNSKSGTCKCGEFQSSARIQSHKQSKGEQLANASSRFIPRPPKNFTIGSLPSNIWAILGLVLVFVAIYLVYLVSSWTITPVATVWFRSSTLWGAVCTCWNKTSFWALQLTVYFFPMRAVVSGNSHSTDVGGAEAKNIVNFDHTAGLFIQAAYSSLAGDAITQELDLQHDQRCPQAKQDK
ncbi:hypothetical protein F5X97DRAFT_322952 [Nemania serpens]|nr:hypothetical protein F5X97DRAFT_322952 [Nemania serpens]